MIRRPNTLSLIRARLAAFRDEERASLSIETVIIFPMLVWVYLVMYVFFDGYRAQSLTDKASFMVADLISREVEYVTNTYLDTVYSVHGAITRSSEPTQVRVSMVQYDEDQGKYLRIWSEARGGIGELTNDMLILPAYYERLPTVPDDEKFVLVQTITVWEPPFNLSALWQLVRQDSHGSLGEIAFDTFTVTRPRFEPQVCFEEDDGTRLC